MAYDMKPTVDQMLTATPAFTPLAAVNRSLGDYLQALCRDGTSAPDQVFTASAISPARTALPVVHPPLTTLTPSAADAGVVFGLPPVAIGTH
jgi:hypothetical protein